MMREKTVFGPIFSRRLGRSLGINLLPENGKLCNFDCIYCECGWNRDGREDRRIPSTEDVLAALEDKLSECAAAGTAIDSITFSGDGEPTLNPDFAPIVDGTIALRDRFYPSARVSVLSNATRIWKEDVFQALRKVDSPILKIDAATDEGARAVNSPQGEYSVARIVSGLERFGGEFILQTMFLRSPVFETGSEPNLSLWMDIVRRLRPRETMVYTIARETPMQGIRPYSEEEMRSLVKPLLDEGFRISING